MAEANRRSLILATGLLPVVGISSAAEPAQTVSAAVEQAHSRLWRERIDKHGVILDYVGELPTPEDCELGRPNAIGWWSPIENGPMFTGIYMPAVCERARRSKLDEDNQKARRLAQGLMTCASVSDVPGFIARGMGTDGHCHYPLTSDDQTHPWFLGLSAYLRSGIPGQAERVAILAKMTQVGHALESYDWRPPCAGAFKGEFRGGFKGRLFRDAVRYLHMLRIMSVVTGDSAWLDKYNTALAERPPGSTMTRIELCAQGYPYDSFQISNISTTRLWIYVGCQWALKELARMESDKELASHYSTGLAVNAADAMAVMDAVQRFDNNDDKKFGNADWRAVYSPAWFPQKTQADAERLSKMGDETKMGNRKAYESLYMRNPLAGAVLLALAGKGIGTVEKTLAHYDYTKIYMSEFFFSECAYYALQP